MRVKTGSDRLEWGQSVCRKSLWERDTAMKKGYRTLAIVTILLLLTVPVAWADGETGTVSGWKPGATVEGTLNGSPWSGWGGTIYMDLTNGPTVPVFCTDMLHHVGVGDTFVASDQEMDCRVKWLLIHYPPRSNNYTPWPDGAPGTLSNRNQEMAARQAAVWYFSDGFQPDPNTTIGQRAWEIIQAVPADACAADAPNIVITPASTVNPVGASQTFTVTVTQGGTPVAGRQVTLATSQGTLSTDVVTTDANGEATFTLSLGMAGTAHITASATLSLPVGTVFVGVDTNKQKLVLGEESSGLVYGYATGTWTGNGSITALSFDDYNMNGVHDEGEPALAGWTIRLYRNGAFIAQQTTDANGQVTFSGLNGTYTVVEVLQSGWYSTTATAQTVTVNNDTRSVGFGQVKLPVIIGRTFQDDDLDGTWDAGEAPLAGWELQLFRDDGSAVVGMKGVTDDQGRVVFSSDPNRDPPDLTAGTYYVQETLQSGWYATTGISGTVTVGSGDVKEVALGNLRPQPALALSKLGPAQAHAGETITYHFTVTNTGNVPLQNVQVSDPLLGGVIADCSTGSLAVGEARSCSVSYAIPTQAPDPLPNTATATATESLLGQASSVSATHTVDLLHPALDLQAGGPAHAYPGETLTLTAVITNTGDAPLEQITVDAGFTITCPSTTLDPGATMTCSGSTVAGQANVITFTVTASGSDGLGGQASAQDQVVVSVDADGDGIPDLDEGTGDADNDGTPNYLDTDSDGDGIADGTEGTGDADNDGTPNYLDTDADGDGIADSTEGTGDADNDG
ncbi:MAG TPA: DUF11 domain-containing protein, partial [Chloroflexi bacterium]|nr:DUF11 domain-containing protein [Chloroflexota bacterium]